MALFAFLKKKKGGSLFGNVIAKIANNYSFGLLGNGDHRKTNQDDGEDDDRSWLQKLFS